jgi:enoyl-CoA hydratase/carnithine racemase
MTKYPDLHTDVQNGVGLITLNRPKALNALSFEMIKGMHEALMHWATLDSVHTVIIQGEGDRAFCAGGDIRSLYDAHIRGDHGFIQDLFREEYTLNYLIATYPKPYMALMDGITMGGGCGVSVHGSHLIVTERTVMAMPETAIGYFPDIGASHFLSKCPGKIGLYLGLTGARLNAADILYANLADYYVPAAAIDELRDQIILGDPIEVVLSAYQDVPEVGMLNDHQAEIDRCFTAPSLSEIMINLQNTRSSWAQDALKTFKNNSPFSLNVTNNLLNNRDINVMDSLLVDFRISQRMIDKPDFYEGVRAVLVDKDNAPRWQPERLDQVSLDQVDKCFEPLDINELELPPL